MLEMLSQPQRWVIPAVLLIALLGIPWMLRRERRRPSSYTRRAGSVQAWLALPSAKQAATDRRTLARSARAEAGDTETSERLEAAGRAAVEAASRTNSLYHP
ncbi:hypothetical protein AB0G67_40740 [Streptomyces sp. NPDC021056]|uniref:hypothetical protein n=1 Tax=Streptomyces sp. NPDC021056 TaxID=3155012 RepID=UPI0033F812AF